MSETAEIQIDLAAYEEFRQRLKQFDSRQPLNVVITGVPRPGFGVFVDRYHSLDHARLVIGDDVAGVPIYYRCWWVHYGPETPLPRSEPPARERVIDLDKE